MSENNVSVPAYPKVIYPGASPQEIHQGSSELMLLWQAISNCAVPLVHQLIQQQPRLIHEKGWHGITPLHKACLVGDWSVCYLLIEAGGDVNALNNFEETPLHYACLRGKANIVHLLVQRGGNINAVDKNGKSMAHHTAQTGSVYVLKYLEMQGISFKSLEKDLKTPLHIACQYGHVDAFKFLVRKERSDLRQVDKEGNTPVHVAAREGYGYLIWLMLQITGCSVLKEANRAGFTPIDLGGRGDRIGHKELKPILEYYGRKSDKNHIPRGPLFSWYFLLLLPGTWYAGLVLLSNFIFINHQAAVILVGMMFLLWYLMKQYHRIPHVCRWPNPIYAGTFAAGLLHTSLLYLGHLLHYNKDYQYYTVFCLCMVIPLYYYYGKLVLTPTENPDSVLNEENKAPLTIIDLCVPQRKLEDFCPVCEEVRQSKTKHCKLCDKCYYQMDHHCLFLLKCIAKSNHVLFIRFLILVLFSMIMFLVNVVLYCGIVYPKLNIYEIITELFWNDGWVLSLVCMNIVSILWGVNLLRFQFNMVAVGQTTVFLAKTKTVLTPGERFLNVLFFLLGKKPFAVDPIICAQAQNV